MTGAAIGIAYWRRRSPGRKRGRPENGRPYEGWKMNEVTFRDRTFESYASQEYDFQIR